jgi:hypothetical protein
MTMTVVRKRIPTWSLLLLLFPIIGWAILVYWILVASEAEAPVDAASKVLRTCSPLSARSDEHARQPGQKRSHLAPIVGRLSRPGARCGR